MAKKIPAYAYTGEHEATSDERYWYIRLKSDGRLKFDYAKTIDVCLVGGGGGGLSVDHYGSSGASGGGGGDVKNLSGVTMAAGEEKAVTIGAGGAPAEDGRATSAFGQSAAGGTAGAGGSGGKDTGGIGADGDAGVRAFGDSAAAYYGGDGGGGAGGQTGDDGMGKGGAGGGGDGGKGGSPGVRGGDGEDGDANTGGGGGGGGSGNSYAYDTGVVNVFGGMGGAGGSGVVIIRGTQDDLIPVFFNGTQLSAVWLNGTKAAGLIYDGVRVYIRRAAQQLSARTGKKWIGRNKKQKNRRGETCCIQAGWKRRAAC